MFSQWASFGRGGPWALTVSLVLLLLGVNLSADTLSPAQALSQRMSALDGMRADIVQKIYANGVVLEESQGTMALAKPNLRWQIDTPLPQVILVRQNELQIYDEDLAQLTIRDWTDAQNETPADVLMEPARHAAELRVTMIARRHRGLSVVFGCTFFVFSAAGNWLCCPCSRVVGDLGLARPTNSDPLSQR